jgi:RNA polymerase sigma-70 factor, ECF subfamily
MTNSADHFEALVGEHYEPLFRFALSLTRAECDARDLTQQTFYTWATKRHQLRDTSKVKSWLFTTLHRAFLAARRKQIRFPHHDWEEVSEQLPILTPELANHVDSSQVLSALSRVDEVYQGAVALFYLEDCSYKDIAEMLEVPVGTVKSRIARGVAQLREIMLTSPSPPLEKTDRERRPFLPSTVDWQPDSIAQQQRNPKPHAGSCGKWDLSPTLLVEQLGGL